MLRYYSAINVHSFIFKWKHKKRQVNVEMHHQGLWKESVEK